MCAQLLLTLQSKSFSSPRPDEPMLPLDRDMGAPKLQVCVYLYVCMCVCLCKSLQAY